MRKINWVQGGRKGLEDRGVTRGSDRRKDSRMTGILKGLRGVEIESICLLNWGRGGMGGEMQFRNKEQE